MQRHWSEAFAVRILKKSGLRLLEQNYQIRQGEIDIILLDDRQILFVEVRYRADDGYGRPEETVNDKKQNRIRRTAEHYLQRCRDPNQQLCRFDLFAVSGGKDNPQWKWIKNAF